MQSDVIDELKMYGMHRHFTGASSVLLFGGGVRKGLLYGKTADESPCTTIEKPVSVTDLHATTYRAMGISSPPRSGWRPSGGLSTSPRTGSESPYSASSA